MLTIVRLKCVTYENVSTKNVTSDFNSHRPFAQILAAQIPKGNMKA
jgi:hypothetical protein